MNICNEGAPHATQNGKARFDLRLRIETEAGVAGIRHLRNALKEMLRRHRIRCISAEEVPDEKMMMSEFE